MGFDAAAPGPTATSTRVNARSVSVTALVRRSCEIATDIAWAQVWTAAQGRASTGAEGAMPTPVLGATELQRESGYSDSGTPQ